MQRRLILAGAAALVAGALAVPAATAGGGSSLGFNAPVKLTIEKNFGGYEPSITVDRFNNIYVTAHKQNHGLALSPDSRATTQARSQSWLWWSSDGKNFKDTPGLTPLQEQNAEFGDEGDLARDDTGHIYFVDTTVTDNSFSRYASTGNGKLALEATRPIGPFGEPVDDRPWIAAHGDKVVLYIGNQGDKATYPAAHTGENYGNGSGPGRYTAYMSYDGGDTFDPLGIQLKDSGWCRPAADHARGSKTFYVMCTNDGGANDVNQNAGEAPYDKGLIYSYVTHDDGKTWNRFTVGSYNAADPWSTYPSLAVAKDGTIYSLFVDHKATACTSPVEQQATGCDGHVKGSVMSLYTSKDHGKHWAKKVITTSGIIRYSWLDVAPNGTLGIAYYYRPDTKSDWYVYAATAKPGQAFHPVNAAPKLKLASRNYPSAFGDFFQIAFGPDSKLNISVTVQNLDIAGLEGLNTDIYYIRQK
ncbi:MAG: hypothetical protein QOK42_2454 [Frankiaceae bacterium]|jgi:hypothetical protein|nr:hypothetical protein [Frankiaceae bacterium]